MSTAEKEVGPRDTTPEGSDTNNTTSSHLATGTADFTPLPSPRTDDDPLAGGPPRPKGWPKVTHGAHVPLILKPRAMHENWWRMHDAERANLEWTDDAEKNSRMLAEWLAQEAVRASSRVATNGYRVNGSGQPSGRREAWARTAYQGETGKVAMAALHTRNDTLNTSALRLYRIHLNDGLLDEDAVTAAMTEAARRAGLPDAEIRATLRSAWAGAQKYGPADDVPEEYTVDVVEVAPGELGRVGGDEPPSSTWQFVDGATFILDIPAVTPANWGEGNDVIWAEGESLMFAGPMGLGKTTLSLRLLRARLGLGGATLLGYPVAPCAGNVLYLAMDRPAQIARAAYRMFTEDEREILRERVKFWRGPPPYDVAKHPGILTSLAEAADATDVYLDSVKDAAIGLSEDEVGAGYNRARQKLLETGRQLAEMHHTTKRGQGGGPPTSVADIYGSAWITNGTGSILLLDGEPGDPIVGMRHVRAPADEVGPFDLLHDQTIGEITVHHVTDLVALAKARPIDGLSVKDAAGALFTTEKPSRAQNEKARRKLAKLVADGLLLVLEGTADKPGGTPPSSWYATDETTP